MSCWKLGGFESVNFRPSQMQKISREPLADAVRMVKKNGCCGKACEGCAGTLYCPAISGLFQKWGDNMKKLLGAALAAATMLATPVAAQAPIAGTTDADPAIWVVKDSDTTIYLFGTVHILKPGLSWFDEAVRTAFDASDELVLEMIEPDQAAMQTLMTTKGIDPDGPPLSEKLAEPARAKYIKAMGDLGVPYQAFEAMKPWMAAITLAVMPLGKYGYDLNSGAEKILTRAATQAGKKLGQLESAEQQLGFFDSLPEEQQIAFLNATVDEIPTLGESMEKMDRAWAKGDPAGLAMLMNESMQETPELTKILLTDRNARWADWIDKRMDQPGTVFIAVGAGHLAGKGSVQDQLKAYRIRAKRIKY